ncbi:MAG: Ig-like domain-containing protein [Armatimonadetes bacterium]|nr:Ig-like domain-containing protein [Armatimonadota bacterium]
MRRWLLILPLLTGLALAEAPPTGIIVDATHLDLQRARFPKLYDPAGKMLYPPPKLISDANYRQGYTGYKPSLAAARLDTKRVGDNPLVIRPVGVNADDPTRGSVDLTEEQAAALRALNQSAGLLDKDKVAIVIGLGIESSTPADGATDVTPEATVTVVFTKRLRRDAFEHPGLLVVTDSQGAALAGAIDHRWQERRVIFRPAQPWRPGESYTVTLSKRIESEIRACLDQDVTLTFTICQPAATDPAAPADKDKGETAQSAAGVLGGLGSRNTGLDE